MREIDAHASSIDAQVSEDIAILCSLRALFDASGAVTRAEFHTFTSFLLSRYSSIRALEWVPRVPAYERDDIERQARNDGLDRFEITERLAQGAMVRAGQRDEYYPVIYVEPLEGNQAALAFDIASNPTRRDALYASRDTGEPRATARVTLVQETDDKWGVLMFVPVYHGKPAGIDERRNAMRGTVLGVLRFHELMIAAGAHRPGEGMIDIALLGGLSDGETELLHDTGLADADLAPGYRYAKQLRSAGGRQWSLIAMPSTAYIAKHRRTTPYVSLVVGLFIAGLTAYYLDRLASEKARVEHQVDERTRALRAQSAALAESNTDLKREVAGRRLLQQRFADVVDHEQRRLGHELHDSLGQQVAVMTLLAQSMQERLEAAGEPVSEHLERLTRSARSAQAQVRALSKGLLPLQINSGGLKVALEQLASSAKDVSDADVEFHAEGDVVRQDDVAATHLYRIAQEALRNALEHGEVSRVAITLCADEQGLTLTIRDDGKGFAMRTPTSGGAGLSSMRHRADLIGAAFEIESPEGGGTSVVCVLPRDQAFTIRS